ncbi:hypothetical protein ACWCPL_42850, partial [Streptomyces sp. NPDC001948]
MADSSLFRFSSGRRVADSDRPGSHPRPQPGEASAHSPVGDAAPDPGDAARVLKELGVTGIAVDGDRVSAEAPP